MRVLASLFVVLACAVAQAAPLAGHVLVIGIDGLGPIGIETAETPHIDALMARGAHSFAARGVMPTSSSPNWASMISGAGPEQHGVLGNKWPLPVEYLKPTVTGDGTRFPTMFYQIRLERPEATMAVIYDWDGFLRLLEKDRVDVVINGNLEDDTTAQAVNVIVEKKPTLTFVHLDHVDHALHGEGFATPPYFEAVAKADVLVGKLVGALESAGILEDTVILLSSDHGGNKKSHGGNALEEYLIPWIIAGPGVVAGKSIETPINIYDTAATVVHVLGIAPHAAWIGRPVLAAFGE